MHGEYVPDRGVAFHGFKPVWDAESQILTWTIHDLPAEEKYSLGAKIATRAVSADALESVHPIALQAKVLFRNSLISGLELDLSSDGLPLKGQRQMRSRIVMHHVP